MLLNHLLLLPPAACLPACLATRAQEQATVEAWAVVVGGSGRQCVGLPARACSEAVVQGRGRSEVVGKWQQRARVMESRQAGR